jgi:hypothetical protein
MSIQEMEKRFDELFQYKNVGYQPDGWSLIVSKKDDIPSSKEEILDFLRTELRLLVEEIDKTFKPHELCCKDTIDDIRAEIKSKLNEII